MLQKIKNNKILINSSVLFLGNILASSFNYIYQLLMGRMLGPVQYGVLASLISIFYIIIVPTNSIMLIVAKYTSNLKAENKLDHLIALFKYFTARLFWFGVVVFIIFIVAAPVLANFLQVEQYTLLIILGANALLAFLLPINRGILKGMHKFGNFSLSLIIEYVTKLIVAVAFVHLGFQVFGALTGYIIGMLVSYLFTFFPLRKFIFQLKKIEKEIKIQNVLKYSIPVLISILSLTLLYTVDVILIKHYFSNYDAGLYSALSMIGKIIFFATTAVSWVMFPMVAEKFAKKECYKKLFWQSFGIVVFIAIISIVIYSLLPELIVNMLYGSDYLSIAPLLGQFAIFISLVSLIQILTNFYLSIQEFRFIPLIVFAAIIQIVLIIFYHQSLNQILNNLVYLNSIAFILIFSVYFFLKPQTTLNK